MDLELQCLDEAKDEYFEVRDDVCRGGDNDLCLYCCCLCVFRCLDNGALKDVCAYILTLSAIVKVIRNVTDIGKAADLKPAHRLLLKWYVCSSQHVALVTGKTQVHASVNRVKSSQRHLHIGKIRIGRISWA